MDSLLGPARLIFSPSNLWLWVVTSVLLSALSNSLAWRVRQRIGKGRFGYLRWPVSLLREVGRALYFVGLPYVALVSGLIPATQAGLVNGDWLADLSLALLLGPSAFLVLVLLRALILWREGAVCGGGRHSRPLPTWVALRESAYQEVHWAFYRIAPLLSRDEPAHGIALGLGIVGLEAWLDPAWRHRWRDPALALGALQTASLAVTMAIVFGLTRNLWLTWGLHVIVERASSWVWRRMAEDRH